MNDTEWFQGLNTCQAKGQRKTLREVVLAILAALCLAGLTIAATEAYGQDNPMARASAGGVVITVYDAPCKLQDTVSNLPKRATWQEAGRTFEGCAAANPQLGVVVFYFREDKSVAAVPMQMFEPVTGV